jgi:NAD(P)H-dependent flavin oxidoreductase YrpB (nitropropane dioxygenase family)
MSATGAADGRAGLPVVIQGGMGVAVSNWRLARRVASLGQLGVVSGTGMDSVLARRLQDGDPGGDARRAMARFPFPRVADAALARYFRPGGREPLEPYRLAPMHAGLGGAAVRGLAALGAFVEVWLAREGHDGPVGINLLTKIQTHALASVYGAMLAGVEYVLMGAGIPREIPGALDRFARGEAASIRLDVSGLGPQEAAPLLTLDPAEFGGPGPALRRPSFLPIVSSNVLATMLARKATGSVEGFVVEGPTAGGHNAPPRGGDALDETGQPVYGERDRVDLQKLEELGRPFWLAGGAGSPGAVREALASGAAGVQVGTLFAFCEESGLEPGLRRRVLAAARAGEAPVRTDPRASPTGFPFKVVPLEGSVARPEVYAARERVCDLGYLREAYRTAEGGVGFRCAAEPVDAYVAKGGAPGDTVGRMCLCNALMADVGLGQPRAGGVEPTLVTSGDDLARIGEFLGAGRETYSAAEVLAYLLGGAA